MKKCAYCDKKRKLTREHIWPKCIINRMPELGLKYIGKNKKITTAELVIADVCGECNNEKLNKLDFYFCSLYDKYFNIYHEEKKPFNFYYEYDLLLRSLLKITFNSSRTVSKDNNFFEKFKSYILHGGETYESIIIKLDIIVPVMLGENKLYPKSTRCGPFDIGVVTDNFILRAISVNSFYFYMILSKNDFIGSAEMVELDSILRRTPGTIIHPYNNETLVKDFSEYNAYNMHIDFVKDNIQEINKLNSKNSR